MPRPRPRFEEEVNEYLSKIDNETEYEVDLWDEYAPLFHNKIMYSETHEPLGITKMRDENGFIKVDLFPFGDVTVINPHSLKLMSADGSYYFLDERHSSEL
jgi:hypothetical protein